MMAWLRLYDSVLDDPKVQRLSDRLFRAWINLLCLAKRHGGEIPKDHESIAFSLRLTVAKVLETLRALIGANLMDETETGYVPHDWNTHQYLSDVSTTRVKQFRKRQRNVSTAVPETPPDTEQNRAEVPLAKASGHPAVSDPWKAVYDRGKEVLGRESGGIITKLRKLYGDKPRKVLAKIDDAAEQREPLTWICAFLHNTNDGGKLAGEYIGGVPP